MKSEFPNTLEEKDWELLLERIKEGECTPFIGAGACAGLLPLGSKIAEDWADEYEYPLKESRGDLARVAQFLAVEYDDPMFPKDKIAKLFREAKLPDSPEPDEPHHVLADLPLAVYITTNYDNFMVQALKKNREKDPKREFCRWNKYVKEIMNQPPIFESELGFDPTAANPVVYHLHGHYELKESLVLTEDDYLDYLIKISEDQSLVPKRIKQAWAGTSLLFLGYRLADWDFRVLFHSISSQLGRSNSRGHVSVQLVPEDGRISEKDREKAQKYFNRYFGQHKIRVYWGTCHEFSCELRNRWEAFRRGK